MAHGRKFPSQAFAACTLTWIVFLCSQLLFYDVQ